MVCMVQGLAILYRGYIWFVWFRAQQFSIRHGIYVGFRARGLGSRSWGIGMRF